MNTLCQKVFNINSSKHYFQLKQEVIAKGILVTGKRRYAMYVTNKEGIAVEELDMKGLELMKSNMNKRFKGFGEQFIKDILFGKAKTEKIKILERKKEELKKWYNNKAIKIYVTPIKISVLEELYHYAEAAMFGSNTLFVISEIVFIL